MTSTLNPACPLCGLRFASKPLLELHIRDDHRPRRREQPGHGEASTVKEVTDMTAARQPRPGQVMTVLRALRHVNDELTLASEAIIRSARAPQSRPQVRTPAARNPHPHTGKERADRAA
jgi:hypothetical protein